jgi:hypothetical protein
MFRRRKMLGLAVTSRSITAVEVVATNGGGRTRRAAEFVFADGAGLHEPASLGRALRQFLRSNGFSASRCVIGMEAKWLTARAKTLPPGASGSIPQILSIMVEREFASDRKDLVFDYALGADTGEQRSVLLVAAPQNVLNGLVLMAQAAGLTVAGITASTMALVAATDNSTAQDRLVLHLFGGGAELALQSKGAMRVMRRLSVSVPIGRPAGEGATDGWLDDLASQLRRVVSLLPAGSDGPNTPELLIWDEAGLGEAARTALSERLAMPVKLCERPGGLESAGAERRPPVARSSAAAAMALGALRGRPPEVDLLHSRLSPERTLAIGRKAAWAAAMAATLIVAGTVLAMDWHSDRLETDSLGTKLKAMAADLDEAKSTISKVTFARPWYDRRPSYLDCMRELTLAFPEEGLIWTTSLAIREDMRVAFSGKAVSESAVLDVLDRLKANPKLSAVQPGPIHQAGRQGREVAFDMSFTFKQSDGTWSSPSAKKSSSRRR